MTRWANKPGSFNWGRNTPGTAARVHVPGANIGGTPIHLEREKSAISDPTRQKACTQRFSGCSHSFFGAPETKPKTCVGFVQWAGSGYMKHHDPLPFAGDAQAGRLFLSPKGYAAGHEQGVCAVPLGAMCHKRTPSLSSPSGTVQEAVDVDL